VAFSQLISEVEAGCIKLENILDCFAIICTPGNSDNLLSIATHPNVVRLTPNIMGNLGKAIP
jgi:hypothetical protein